MTWRATLWIWRNASSLMGGSASGGIPIVVVTTPGSTCFHRAWYLSPNARADMLSASTKAENRLMGFPPNRGGFLYAASDWMAAIFVLDGWQQAGGTVSSP